MAQHPNRSQLQGYSSPGGYEYILVCPLLLLLWLSTTKLKAQCNLWGKETCGLAVLQSHLGWQGEQTRRAANSTAGLSLLLGLPGRWKHLAEQRKIETSFTSWNISSQLCSSFLFFLPSFKMDPKWTLAR